MTSIREVPLFEVVFHIESTFDTFENTGTEPLVTLRYFGPDAQPKAPNVGDHKKK